MPAEPRGPKYDATAGALIAVLKQGSTPPFHRLEQHQDSLGVPLPASDQWETIQDAAEDIAPVGAALICRKDTTERVPTIPQAARRRKRGAGAPPVLAPWTAPRQ